PGTSAVLPQMRALLNAFRRCGRPIVHIVRLYTPDGTNVDECRRMIVEQGASMLLAGSPGSELAPDLLPENNLRLDAALLLNGGIQKLAPREVAMYKPRWGAFYHTTLEAHLRDLEISPIVFCGCNFPNCPRTSIYEASERDFRVVLAQDAVSGLYAKSCDALTNIGVAILPTNEIVRELERSCGQSIHSQCP